MNIFFRWLFRNIPPEEEARHLVERATASAYQIFIDKDFRKLTNFENQNQTEQDRIFNELVVTAILYLIFLIEDRTYHLTNKRFHFWKQMEEEIPKVYLAWLKNLGLVGPHLDLWKKLLDMRKGEYLAEMKNTREVWASEFAAHPDKDVLNELAVRLETLTVGLLLHITRGKANKNADDPLRRRLRTWLGALEIKFAKRVGW